MEWIGVRDRLPDNEVEVLMCNEEGCIRVGYYQDCGGYTRLKFGGLSKALQFWNIKVTHWMPLPEPPKGD